MGFFDKFKKAGKLADKAQGAARKAQYAATNPEGFAEDKAKSAAKEKINEQAQKEQEKENAQQS